jgi:transposase
MSSALEVKATEVTADPRIVFKNGIWLVPSQANGSVRYRVNPSLTNPSCDCDDFALRGAIRPCKHVEAVRLLLDRQMKGEPVPVAPPRPKRPTYGQRWDCYNEAQVYEKDMFQELLADLCAAIIEPPPKPGRKGGRPSAPLRDAVFMAVFKVYSTVSARRFMSDLREAQRRGHVNESLSFNWAWKTLQNPAVTPILHEMIRRSSLPLRAVEVDFATDSSGFATSKFVKWFDEKYGSERQKAEWVKVHCCVGVKTGITTAAVIGDKHLGDSPQFPELVNTTAQHFTIRDVDADKAYLSADNFALVEALGGTAYIPFKVNSVLGNTPLWDKMLNCFLSRREEYLAHYHKRSNIESIFSAIKRKFGDAVRSRTQTAMRNEVLAKLVCNNLTCVILASYELGIDPADWGMKRPEESADSAELPAVLRFPGAG